MKHQLPLRCGPDGTPLRYDVLRPQRLAAPAKVYVEQFSAHPLEGDAEELYGPPDGYLQADGTFSRERKSPDDPPVYEIELQPGDGYYPLSYMAVQADGSAWEEECAQPFAPEAEARQPFLPDGSRSFEETGWALTTTVSATLSAHAPTWTFIASSRQAASPKGCRPQGGLMWVRATSRRKCAGALSLQADPPRSLAAAPEPRQYRQHRAARAVERRVSGCDLDSG